MGKLILYSLVAHLIILGLLFTIPQVSEKKPTSREMYRVSFVELPGALPQQKDGAQAAKAPEPKKIEAKKKTAAAERKKEAVKPRAEKKEAKPKQEKKVEKLKPEKKAEKPQPVKKKEPVLSKTKEAPKPQKPVEKELAPPPRPAKEAPVKEEPQKAEKTQPKPPEPVKGVTREEKPEEVAPPPSPRREEEEKAPEPVLKGEGKESPARPAEEAPSATASLGPKGVGKLSLENVDFPYSYYLAVMQRKIAEHWRPVYGEFERRGGKRVVVYFRVLRDGSIQDLKIEESSGDETLDRSAAKAIMEASPLPPLPYEFRGEELRVHFGFEYSDEG